MQNYKDGGNFVMLASSKCPLKINFTSIYLTLDKMQYNQVQDFLNIYGAKLLIKILLLKIKGSKHFLEAPYGIKYLLALRMSRCDFRMMAEGIFLALQTK